MGSLDSVSTLSCLITQSLPSAVLVAWLKSIPPATAVFDEPELEKLLVLSEVEPTDETLVDDPNDDDELPIEELADPPDILPKDEIPDPPKDEPEDPNEDEELPNEELPDPSNVIPPKDEPALNEF